MMDLHTKDDKDMIVKSTLQSTAVLELDQILDIQGPKILGKFTHMWHTKYIKDAYHMKYAKLVKLDCNVSSVMHVYQSQIFFAYESCSA